MKRLLPFLFLIIPCIAIAQTEPPCSSIDHRSFDFWLGTWNVYDTNEQQVGTNHIELKESGCLLTERWVGRSGTTGTSVNYFDSDAGCWRQVWVDNKGGQLQLQGNYDGASMVMTDSIDAHSPFNRITWTPNPEGEVHQHWERKSPEGEFSTLFYGIYRPN